VKGYDVSATLTCSLSQATGFTVVGHYRKKRQTAVEGQELETYPGFSAAFAQRVKILNHDYRASEDCLKSLFIPNIVVGTSAEWQHCNGDAMSCENALQSQLAVTPYIEIKATMTAQFRIGFPIQRSVTFGKKTQVALAPALQYVVQRAGAK
jgi:hypothetical protein